MKIWQNKRPMGHITHMRKQFKSTNTYDYIITLIKRRKKPHNFIRIYWFFIWIKLNPLHPRMLYAKFGWNWPSGSGGEDENVKSLRRRQTTKKFWSEKLTWAFSSDELKTQPEHIQHRQAINVWLLGGEISITNSTCFTTLL